MRWAKALCFGALLSSLLVAGLGLAAPSALAATATTPVDLGSASTYAVFSGASVGNTVNAAGAPFTTLRGDLGVAVDAQPTGFPPGVVTGSTQVGTPAAVQAQTDLKTAYNNVAGRTGGTTIPGALGGTTLTPGLYSIAGAVSNTTTLTLNGPGVYVFQVGGAMTMAAGAQITLENGAQASDVFWQVNGAGGIGANALFVGTLMAHDAIAVGADTIFNGRALALTGAVSLNANDFYSSSPTVTITGGATGITNDSAPNITGTTDLQAPGVVTVTIAGQTLTATPTDEGTWSVNSAILADGTYTVVASVTDGAGNTSSATQQLTIDTVPPVIAINGGPSVSTNDPTRTIAGTTNAAPGTIVDVSIGTQTLTALVQPSGTWNIAPSALSDGTYTITASVTDLAGNVGTTTQKLILDTVAPAVTITGGTTRLTDDPTPQISGTAAVAPGTVVTVNLADQTLTALVQTGGTWSVNAAFLADGPHRIIMTVTDAYGNTASATQTLTVDTVAPTITINGGTTATTSNVDPTIAGTSNAASGSIVTVSIAGQTMTTLLQTNGTWNATPTPVGDGTWLVAASVPDPAGNVGTATQTLTITSATSGGSGGSGGSSPVGSGSTGSGSTGSGSTGSGSAASGGAGSYATGPTGSDSRLMVWLSAAKYKDARGKRVRVPFLLNGPAKVTLTVLHGKKVVAKLSTTRRKAGYSLLTWNGKIKKALDSKGSYKIMMRAVSPAGASAQATAALRIG